MSRYCIMLILGFRENFFKKMLFFTIYFYSFRRFNVSGFSINNNFVASSKYLDDFLLQEKSIPIIKYSVKIRKIRPIIQMSNSETQEKKSIKDEIFSLAVPALAGLTIDPLMSLVDTVFIGRFSSSSASLAGVGSSASLLTFSFYLFTFLTTATTPLVAKRRASNAQNEAAQVAGQALTLALVSGSLVGVLLYGLSQPLLEIMGTGFTGMEANSYATTFLHIRSVSAPFVLVTAASIGILRGFLDTRTPLVILLGANLINFLLDFLLIPVLGIEPSCGAAIATTTAECISGLWFIGILAGLFPTEEGKLGSNQVKDSSLDIVRIKPTSSIPSMQEIQPLLTSSSASFLRSISLQLALSYAAIMAAKSSGYIGGTASANVAGHQIALQIWFLGSCISDSLAAAAQALIADAIGRENFQDVQDTTKAILQYSLVLGLSLATFLALGVYLFDNQPLVTFFTKDKTTKEALLTIFPLLILSQPLNAFVFALDGIIQGASEFVYESKAMVISVFSAFLFYTYGFADTDNALLHIWQALTVLMFMRGLTVFLKVVDRKGPIQLKFP